MVYRLIVSGLVSGAIAGVIATVLHLLLVEPLIFAAEQFEGQGPAVAAAAAEVSHDHVNGLTHAHAGGAALHAHEKTANTRKAGNTEHIHEDGSTHVHEAWEPADGIQRSGLTLVVNILIGIAYGTLLATALTLYGHGITIQQGAIWGIAGYLCFNFLRTRTAARGSCAAAFDLFPRQVWWLATAFVSALGLALLAFGNLQIWKPVGLILLITPHVFGRRMHRRGGWHSATRACVSFRYDHIIFWCNDVASVGHCHGLYIATDGRPPDGHTTRHLVLIADTRLTKGRHTSMAGGGGFEDIDGQRRPGPFAQSHT